MKRRERGYASLIGMLVVIAIIGIVAAFYYGGPGTSGRADGLGKSNVGRAVLRARDSECKTNIGQVRNLVEMAHIDDLKLASLQDLNAPHQTTHCPIGHEPYELDVESQRVTCPHPGHEKY